MRAAKNPEYTAQQLETAERTAMQIAAMPKDTRMIAVMVANAYMDGLLAGQGIKNETRAAADVLAD